MDLVSGIYEEVSAGQEMHRLTGKWGRTDQVFQEVRETIVAQEHQEQMRRFLDTSTLPQRLRDTESVAMEYHAASGSWHLARFIVKKRDKSGRVTSVLYVVRQIDKQKQQELEYREKLVAAAEEARRANMAKTDFLRRMRHDIPHQRHPGRGVHGRALPRRFGAAEGVPGQGDAGLWLSTGFSKRRAGYEPAGVGHHRAGAQAL